ncbi:MAG: peptidylprolyl isomerase [Pseudohongiellaceae bacterium]|nr:peptidylprolyl isomerase [Pseudohongiellaceae bacterium]
MIKKFFIAQVSRYIRRITFALFAFALVVGSSALQANTIVRVSTSYGDFSIELFDDVAPVSVQNFLNYVERGDYDGTFFSRLIPDFVLQGGSYRFEPFVGPIAIPTDPAIENEFNLTNARGTVAMARIFGEQSSATSAFFINLVDNNSDEGTNLDTTDGGYAVFGQVLGDGMDVVDAISELPTYAPGSLFPNLPLRNFDGVGLEVITEDKFVTLSMEVVERFSSAVSVFEYGSGTLMTSVDAGLVGRISLKMDLLTEREGIVLKVDQASLVPLEIVPEGGVTFSLDDNRLRIPSLELNNNGVVSVATDVVLLLTDAENLEFTLESIQL